MTCKCLLILKRWLANEKEVENYTFERKKKKKKKKKEKRKKKEKKISERVEDRRERICLFSNMYQNVTGHCSKSRSSPVTDVLNILNLSHTFNSVIAQYGSISNLCSSSSSTNAADTPSIAYTHRIQPLRYISSTARLLMSSTDVETFSTADIEEYAKLLGLRLQYLNAFIRPIGILHL